MKQMKKVSKNEDKITKDTIENDKRKYKKGDDSGSGSCSESDEETNCNGSDGGGNGSGSDGGGNGSDGGDKFDMHEYRKMLAEIFPSKYMNNRISKLESQEKLAKPTSISCASNVSNKKSNKNEKDKIKENNEDDNRKITRSMAKELNIKPKEVKPIEKGKKRNNHNPPLPNQDEYDTSSTSTNCSDSEDECSESEDDKYSAGFGEFATEQLQNGKFNIVINLVNDKKHNKLDEDDSEEDDS